MKILELTYKVESLPSGSGTLALPPELSRAAGAVPEIILELGAIRWQARLAIDRSQRSGHVGLSQDLIDSMHIPLDCPFRIRVSKRLLRFGPVVGIVASTKAEELTPSRLQTMENHLETYRHLAGLFVVFALDRIDAEQRAVQGYRYGGGGKQCWEAGTFPLPRVIYRRFGVPVGPLLPRLQLLEVHVFNERIFNKWESWQWSVTDPALKEHLPETVSLKAPADVLQMVEKHGAAFVKPVWGSLAAGIVYVKRTSSGFTLNVTRQGQVECADVESLERALRPVLPKMGMVQQALSLVAVGDRLVDFRVVVQKDGHGQWTVPGIVGRCGTASLFVSNMATGGFPLAAEDALALIFGRSPSLIFRRKLELTELGITVASALENGGLRLGDLGLDIAYDHAHNPWVIEANNRDPDHNISWEYGSWPMFYRFRTLPMEFSCHLDGFDSRGACL